MRERETERERMERTDTFQKENETCCRRRVAEGFLGPVMGWLERGVTAPLEAIMRSVVDGSLIGLLAPPLLPISGTGHAGTGKSAQTLARNNACLFL